MQGISCASIVAIERLRLRGRLTANQSESAAFRYVRGNPVCQRARLRIHSVSRLYIFPCLRTVEMARLSASLVIASDDNDPRSRDHGPSRVSLFLGRHKTTIDRGARRYFARSKGIPSSKKSFGLGKAVSTILFHSRAVPSCTLNSNSSQYPLIIA